MGVRHLDGRGTTHLGQTPSAYEREHGGDYWRFTPQGIVLLFEKLKVVEVILANTGGIVYIGEKE